MDALLILGALMLLGKRSSTGGSASGGSDSDLLKRANGKRAHDWFVKLREHGASEHDANGLTRWMGIESSGNPLAISPIGERGLLQSTRTTALVEKLFTPEQWAALVDPNTTNDTHAMLALKQFAWHKMRAKRLIYNAPPDHDVASWMWYAKAHHTRPQDLVEGKAHGPALQMTRDLQTRWKDKPAYVRRLRVANVIAFGELNP